MAQFRSSEVGSCPRAISVVGLGKLGACTAAALSMRGFDVIGVDISERVVTSINEGRAPVQEPRLQEAMDESRGRLRATSSYEEAIRQSDVTFIIVQTPSESSGRFSMAYVRDAALEIAGALSRKGQYHLIVLTSTVMPGDTEAVLLRVLEETSGKVCGRDFGLCFSPEFIALGNVIDDFLNPDLVLIGELDKRSGDILEAIYRKACENDPPAARMNIVNAELTKIAINTYVTTKISFANMIAEICQRLPGGNVDVVADAMGKDRRIGRSYLTGAVSYGGPCFPRDNVALATLGDEIGANAGLARATDTYNTHHTEWLIGQVLQVAENDARAAAVIGLSYRPGTPVIEKSTGMRVAEALVGSGMAVTVFDSSAAESAYSVLGDRVTYASSIRECLTESDIVVLATEGQDASNLSATDFSHRQGRPVEVFDTWRVCLEQLKDAKNVSYHAVGIGPRQSAGGAKPVQVAL